MTARVVALTFLYFLSFFFSFSRQLHLATRSSVKARRREGAAEAAAAAKWRACVRLLRMQLRDAWVGVKSRREVQPEVCGAGRQTRDVGNTKKNKNDEAALWVSVPHYSVDLCTLKMARHCICCHAKITSGSLACFLLWIWHLSLKWTDWLKRTFIHSSSIPISTCTQGHRGHFQLSQGAAGTSEPGENPDRHPENMQTPQRKTPCPGIEPTTFLPCGRLSVFTAPPSRPQKK